MLTVRADARQTFRPADTASRVVVEVREGLNTDLKLIKSALKVRNEHRRIYRAARDCLPGESRQLVVFQLGKAETVYWATVSLQLESPPPHSAVNCIGSLRTVS